MVEHAQAGQPRSRLALLDLDLASLERELAALGAGAYRARQIYKWLHVRNTANPRLMTDLPAPLREALAELYPAPLLSLASQQRSSDGTVKFLWHTAKGHPVEAVLMPGFEFGTTACLSTQSGCPLGCKFCKTGELGLHATLSAGAILQQLYDMEAQSQQAVDRIVLMGMGEPLLNLDALQKSCAVLCDPQGRDWSPRRITVSTVGLAKPMLELARSGLRLNLALSLHFTTNDTRRAHMPKADEQVMRLAEACYFYRRVNGGKVTVEYMLLQELNDTETDAQRLIQFARLAGLNSGSEILQEADAAPKPARMQSLPLHVNLIEYNPVGASQYRPAPEAQLNRFARGLRDAGIPVTVRHSRGRDIAAACGMLSAAGKPK